jgi:hypothetical protein
MVARVVVRAVAMVLTVLALTGCGRQASKESLRDLDLLATGPNPTTLPTPQPFVTAVIDAAGGLSAWEQCKELAFRGAVTACARDGCFYLTEHDFVLCPWSDAIQITAHEPRANFVWQIANGRYLRQADPNLDVSPLKGLNREYADAVLQIVTAPVRLLDRGILLSRRPDLVQITGQWYLPIDAKYRAGETGAYWTLGTYFQSQDLSLVDMIWLGNPAAQKFLIVRGYDYVKHADSGILTPTKIEVFQSDPEANIGPRFALVDLTR